MCPVMSWLLCLCLWVSVTAIQLCQATFYDTIQQHPGTRPGRTTIHMIGERTADCSDKPKQMFSPPSDICVMSPRQQHPGFWLLVCLIRLSQALEKITSLFFHSRFVFPSWFIIIASTDTWGWSSYQLFSKRIAQWLFFSLRFGLDSVRVSKTDGVRLCTFSSWAITVDIHATLLDLNFIRASVVPEKLQWIEYDRNTTVKLFFFLRQAEVSCCG